MLNSACHLVENLEIEAGETSTDNLFTVERVACIGACSLAPAITLNDVAAGHLNADQLEKIIADLKADGLS